MIQALTVADALAVAEASRRRSRDERAMAQYLGIGRSAERTAQAPPLSTFVIAETIDLAAFESDERQRLEHAIKGLSPEARRELIALVSLAQRPSLDFAAAMRRTRRIPLPAQTGYLMGIPLERYIALGLEKLGYSAA